MFTMDHCKTHDLPSTSVAPEQSNQPNSSHACNVTNPNRPERNRLWQSFRLSVSKFRSHFTRANPLRASANARSNITHACGPVEIILSNDNKLEGGWKRNTTLELDPHLSCPPGTANSIATTVTANEATVPCSGLLNSGEPTERTITVNVSSQKSGCNGSSVLPPLHSPTQTCEYDHLSVH